MFGIVEEVPLEPPDVVEDLPPLGSRIDRHLEAAGRHRLVHLLALGDVHDGRPVPLGHEDLRSVGADLEEIDVVDDLLFLALLEVVEIEGPRLLRGARVREPVEEDLPETAATALILPGAGGRMTMRFSNPSNVMATSLTAGFPPCRRRLILVFVLVLCRGSLGVRGLVLFRFEARRSSGRAGRGRPRSGGRRRWSSNSRRSRSGRGSE